MLGCRYAGVGVARAYLLHCLVLIVLDLNELRCCCGSLTGRGLALPHKLLAQTLQRVDAAAGTDACTCRRRQGRPDADDQLTHGSRLVCGASSSCLGMCQLLPQPRALVA